MSDNTNLVYVGIDVSKEYLDVYVNTKNNCLRFSQTEQGLSDLVEYIKPLKPAIVALESTGGLENKAASMLASNDIPVAILNPRQIRDFAKATGTLAKTDEIDAKIIALFAKAIKPNITAIPDKELSHLKALVARRAQLVYMLGQERNRLSAYPSDPMKSITKHIAWLEKELDRLDNDIDNFIKSSPIYCEKIKITESMPGCGPITAVSILAYIPELGKLNNKKIVLLAGLAPINYDSGKKRGRRFIRGGRRNIRSILYMSALTAIRYNPVIKRFYQTLISRGKPKKVAITACMRKILVTLNAMARTQTTWSLKEVSSPS